MSDLIGKTLSHYNIIEKLGEGGMGVVYKAEDTRLHRIVALKFLPLKVGEDADIKARFFQEARAASALDHTNIATIYEIEEAENQWFIAMAYVEGQALKKKIQSGVGEGPSPLPLEEATDIAIQVAEGLAAAHAKGIIHRDIKSANIMLTPAGQVKITDFGLAKFKDSSLVTKEGTVMGTPAYMSPEQAKCEDADHRSDIFSLGVVLYEMLTGHLPFTGDNDLAVLYSIVHQKPEPICKAAPHVSSGLEQIASKALEKEKEKRYQSMDEMLGDLYIIRGELGAPERTRARTIAAKESRERRLKRMSIPIGILFLFVIGFFLLKPLFFEQVLIPEPKSIAVISFENQTGDKTLDYLQQAIPNLLITSLEQSPYLRLTTWERMRDLLKQMEKEDVEIIDRDLGFELCRKDGVDAIVIGMFTKAGETFVTDVKVLNAKNKDLLKSASSKGKGEESILEAQIDELSNEISLAMGVPDSIIVTTQLPIAEVATSSMDAYNYFYRGRNDCEKYYFQDAVRFLEKAVELDSTFAVAYLYLGLAYTWLGNIKAGTEAISMAKTFTQKAPDKEKLYIEAVHAQIIEKDTEKRIRILEQLARKYPQEKRVHYSLAVLYSDRRSFHQALEEFDKVLKLDPNYGSALNELAYTYSHLGNFEKAIEAFKQYASVSPGDANPFDSMADTYLKMGELDEAIAKYKEALEVKPDFGSDWKIAYIYALRENYSEAMKWIDQFINLAPTQGTEAEGWLWKGFYYYWLFNLDYALHALRRAEELAEEVDNTFVIAYVNWTKAWIDCENREFESSQILFKKWLEFFEKDFPKYLPFYRTSYNFYQSLMLLNCGKIDSARFKLAEIESQMYKIHPAREDQATFQYNVLYGEVSVAEDSLENAVEALENSSPLEMAHVLTETVLRYNVPYLRDVLARAYRNKGELDKSIAEYERIITFDPETKERCLIHPTYHYRLAKLYEEKGRLGEAIKEYEKFLEIWKDADEDLPDLIDAKARLAGLTEER